MARIIKLTSPYPTAKKSSYRKKETKPNQGRENPNRQVYDDSKWRKLSKQIRQQEPLCRLCLTNGVHSASEVVDHIIPINSGGDAFDPDNLQPLCRRCHEKKSAKEKHLKELS